MKGQIFRREISLWVAICFLLGQVITVPSLVYGQGLPSMPSFSSSLNALPEGAVPKERNANVDLSPLGRFSSSSIELTAHVVGEVAQSGTYRFVAGTRVMEILQRAGQILPKRFQVVA